MVWNIWIIFPYIGNVIIPTDFHIFQRGRYTTNQILKPGPGWFLGPKKLGVSPGLTSHLRHGQEAKLGLLQSIYRQMDLRKTGQISLAAGTTGTGTWDRTCSSHESNGAENLWFLHCEGFMIFMFCIAFTPSWNILQKQCIRLLSSADQHLCSKPWKKESSPLFPGIIFHHSFPFFCSKNPA